MVRSKRRGYPLRRWLRLGTGARAACSTFVEHETGERRRSLEQFKSASSDDYPTDAIRRNYAAWGCSPPAQTERKD